MFQTPRKTYHSHETVEELPNLPSHFGILSWNVNKQRQVREFRQLFHHLKAAWNLHLLCLQEARFQPGRPFLVEGFHYYASANLARGKTHYGVLTASSAKSGESLAGLSEGRELYFTTRKPYLLNTLPLPNGQTLLCLNLHAINFRENAQYTRELRELTTHLTSHRGPMILSGDFNSWNPVRQKRLETFRRQLSLESVPFDRKKLKGFGGYPLDFIFYRGLALKRFAVLELPEYSDHNPLLAEFETPNNKVTEERM